MPAYLIGSFWSGLFVTITRLSDAASVMLSGDDSAEFTARLNLTNDTYTDDDLCAEYDSVMAVDWLDYNA